MDRYFLENRARLIEIAAFFDRVDRAEDPDAGRGDFRYRALVGALRLVLDEPGDRAIAAHKSFSDPSPDPLESAAGLSGACGAWEGEGDRS